MNTKLYSNKVRFTLLTLLTISTILLGSIGWLLIIVLIYLVYFYYNFNKTIVIFGSLVLLYFIITFINFELLIKILAALKNYVFLDDKTNVEFEAGSGDTATFRLALMTERIVYLIENNYFCLVLVFFLDKFVTLNPFVYSTFNDANNSYQIFETSDIIIPILLIRFGLIAQYYTYPFCSIGLFFKSNKVIFLSLLIILLISSVNSSLLYRMNYLPLCFF